MVDTYASIPKTQVQNSPAKTVIIWLNRKKFSSDEWNEKLLYAFTFPGRKIKIKVKNSIVGSNHPVNSHSDVLSLRKAAMFQSQLNWHTPKIPSEWSCDADIAVRLQKKQLHNVRCFFCNRRIKIVVYIVIIDFYRSGRSLRNERKSSYRQKKTAALNLAELVLSQILNNRHDFFQGKWVFSWSSTRIFKIIC